MNIQFEFRGGAHGVTVQPLAAPEAMKLRRACEELQIPFPLHAEGPRAGELLQRFVPAHAREKMPHCSASCRADASEVYTWFDARLPAAME